MPRLTKLPAGLRVGEGKAHFEVIVPKTGGRVRRRQTVAVASLREALERFDSFKREVLEQLDDFEHDLRVDADASAPSLETQPPFEATPPVDAGRSGHARRGATVTRPSADRDELTFAEYVDRHLDAVCSRVKPKTQASYRQFVRNHLLPDFGARRLSEIDEAAILDYPGQLATYVSPHPRWRGRPLSLASINGCLTTLRLLLRDAFMRRIIGELPRVAWPIKTVPELHLEASDAERRRLLAAFDDEEGFRRLEPALRPSGLSRGANRFPARPRTLRGSWPADHPATTAAFERFRALKPLYIVAFEAGLRRGDLLVLAPRNLDMDAGVIRVTMQKTGKRVLVPMSDACHGALLAALARSPESSTVFTDADGEPVSEATFAVAFSTAKSLAGITRRFRPHDMRHTFASRLSSQNVSLQVISRAMGHSTISLTERYARPSDESIESIRRAFGKDGDGSP